MGYAMLVVGLLMLVGCTTERPPDNAIAVVVEDDRLQPMAAHSVRQFEEIYPFHIRVVHSWSDVPDGWWPVDIHFSREKTEEGVMCVDLLGLSNFRWGTIKMCEDMDDAEMQRVLTHEFCHVLGAPGNSRVPHWKTENGACDSASSGVLQDEERLRFAQLWDR